MQHPYEPFVSLEARVAHLAGRVDQGFADMRDRLNSIDQRFDSLEQRLAARFSQFEQRIDTRFSQFEQRFDVRFAHFESRINGNVARIERKSDRQFFWLLSILIVSVLLPLAHLAGH